MERNQTSHGVSNEEMSHPHNQRDVVRRTQGSWTQRHSHSANNDFNDTHLSGLLEIK